MENKIVISRRDPILLHCTPLHTHIHSEGGGGGGGESEIGAIAEWMVGMREMEGREGRKKRNSPSLSSFLSHNTGEDGTFIPFKGGERETW